MITGIGCVSCFGMGTRAFIDAILSGETGIAPITRFDTGNCRSHSRGDDPRLRSGGVHRAAQAPARRRGRPHRARVHATALRRCRLCPGRRRTRRHGHRAGHVHRRARQPRRVSRRSGRHGPTGVPAILFSNTVSNAPASLCAIEFGLRGPNVTFNQREASSLGALAFSVGAIREGRTTAMVTRRRRLCRGDVLQGHDRFRALSPMRRRSGRHRGGATIRSRPQRVRPG